MAVAFDGQSEFPTSTTAHTGASSFSWTHTPAGTPRGVLVFVNSIASSAKATTVTYGGADVPNVTGGTAIDTAGEPGAIQTFFLGTGIPTGPQTVVVNRSDTTTGMYATAMTVTAAKDTEVPPTIVLLQEDGTYAQQNVDDGSPGTNSLRFAAGYSGGSSVLAAGGNSTALQSIDYGVYTFTAARETTPGQGPRPVGFTYATSDDRAAVHLAVREIVVLTPGDYRIWPATNGPAVTSDVNSADLGAEWYVTASPCTFDGYYWWCPTGGDTTASRFSFRLYSTTDGATGTLIAAATVTTGFTLVANSWNYIPIPTPVSLTAGTRYRAVVHYTSGANFYGVTANYFTTGGGGASNIVNGPLVCPNATNTLANEQGSFNEPSGSPAFPTNTFNNSNYWIDVAITYGSGATVYGLAGSALDASLATGAISLTGVIAGSALDASDADGVLGLTGVVAGTALDTSQASGAIARVTPLAGAAVSASVANGTLGVAGAVAGSAAAASHADGSVSRVSPLAGSATSLSHGDGAVTISTGPVTYTVAGSATALSLATGTVTMTGVATGSSVASSHADGSLGTVRPAAGSAVAASSAAGTLAAVGAVSGTALDASQVDGTLAMVARLAGSAVAVSAASGAVTRTTPLAGSAAGVSHGDGAVSAVTGPVTWPLAGAATAASSATGTVALRAAVSGVSTAVAAATATLSAKATLSGQSATSSATAGAIATRLVLAGSAVAASTASGQLGRLLTVSGLSISVSGGDGAIQPPFFAAELPSDLRATVSLDPGVTAVVSLDGIGVAIATDALSVEVS